MTLTRRFGISCGVKSTDGSFENFDCLKPFDFEPVCSPRYCDISPSSGDDDRVYFTIMKKGKAI